MSYTILKTLTFEDFLKEYGDHPRYELIDGELRDMEPTGPHESVAGTISGYIFQEILKEKKQWVVPKNCLIKPPAALATALRPDVIVLDEKELRNEPLWQQEPIIYNGSTIKIVFWKKINCSKVDFSFKNFLVFLSSLSHLQK
jgi:Uma2 family endonuclease